ncbi:predicted protein, partial [Nematostella vectensis]
GLLQFSLTEFPRAAGKVAIVTGGNCGIGYETARGLIRSGMTVIMGCRSEKAAESAIQHLKDEQPDARVRYIHLDLSDLSSVREFVKSFHQSENQLNVLVNNAGVMLTPYALTKDGFEQQIGICHFGHFLLTMLLLDTLKKSGTKDCHSRIVTVSSTAHSSGSINFEDLQSKKSYSRFGAYAQAKVANVLFTYALQRRLSIDSTHVTANALHPGVVNTELFRHLPWIARAPMGLFFLTPEQGAATSLYACLSPDLEGVGGKYLANCEVQSSSAYSYNEDIQERLWRVSRKLTGIGNE